MPSKTRKWTFVFQGGPSPLLDAPAQIRVFAKLKLQNVAWPDFRAGFFILGRLLCSQKPRPAPRFAHGSFGVPEAGY
jgi:hypothetical protein